MKYRKYLQIKNYADKTMEYVLGAFFDKNILAITTTEFYNIHTGKRTEGEEKVETMVKIAEDIDDALFSYKKVTLPVTKVILETQKFPFGIEVPIALTTVSSVYEITIRYTYIGIDFKRIWQVAEELKLKKVKGIRDPYFSATIFE